VNSMIVASLRLGGHLPMRSRSLRFELDRRRTFSQARIPYYAGVRTADSEAGGMIGSSSTVGACETHT
jgi:hypothetical protein